MQEQKNKQKKKLITVLSGIVKNRRKKLNKTIYLISAEASVPRSTWRDIEFCLRQDINLTTFCKSAEGLDLTPDELLKELVEKLGKDFSFSEIDL